MSSPVVSPSVWSEIAAHHQRLAELPLAQLFEADPGRFERLSARADDLLLDVSKCHITSATLDLLANLAQSRGVPAARDAQFAGEAINQSENRAAFHSGLRDLSGGPAMVGGVDMAPHIRDMRARATDFAETIRTGRICGITGAVFTDIVNIGIGGSDLGPAMAVGALKPYHDGPRLHFVSNVDGAHLHDTLAALDPAKTLFIVASKTFTTIETMTNARSARQWIASRLGEAAIEAHFAAVSTALDKVAAFGITPDRVFGIWDWVGGRYSIWSAIGLPLMIAIGASYFDDFLRGGNAMDAHFKEAPILQNLPMLLGLMGVWHRNVCGYASRAVIPYDQRLARFPAYLQQLDMESNGKSVQRDGTAVLSSTGPVIFGEPGTNGQHAFFQLLHQGTDIIPVEFLIAAESHEADLGEHHALLIANCLAQSQALMQGRSRNEAKARLIAMGRSDAEAEALAPHRTFAGNRPSITLAYRKLDPFTLGRLIALYEHRIFVEAAIWGINPFDQWGVELGKELAANLLDTVKTGAGRERLDSSTAGLADHLRAFDP